MENCVVGAPCGVMDQMAAALGEAGALLALRCQPAEVLPPVALPAHIRLWGVDSGIRHRRAATFPGAYWYCITPSGVLSSCRFPLHPCACSCSAPEQQALLLRLSGRL